MKSHRRFAAAAAILLLCIAIPLGVGAAGRLGVMRDITNWQGAIVGQKYEQATGAITVTASVKRDTLKIAATFAEPEERPFRYIEELTISDYELRDAAGKKVRLESEILYAPVTDGLALLELPLQDLAPGCYTLKISAFTGAAKAEQPLEMTGNWEVTFSCE